MLTVVGGGTIEAIGDTGAGPSLISEVELSVEVLKSKLRPGKARALQSASTHRIHSKGGAPLEFRLGNASKVFRHEFQVIEGNSTPTILGVDFWAQYDAQFDFKSRQIVMHVGGQAVTVPFKIGDEEDAAPEIKLYAVDDIVIPARSGTY